MCVACNCPHCKDGDCDMNHNAHEWIRRIKEGFPEEIAYKEISKEMEWDPAFTVQYVNAKKNWVKPLPSWLKDDKGGTA